MNLPNEFTHFIDLPKELRLQIWELLEPPERVIGQVPCSNCGLSPSTLLPSEVMDSAQRQRCKETSHPEWDFQYIVHPRSEAIFAPLHVCRESREVWLPRFCQPPRYCTSATTTHRVRFTVPFISYDHDIFTVLEVLVAYQEGMGSRVKADILPDQAFTGLDHGRIRFVGMRENADLAWTLMSLIPFPTLPAMESFTLITLGPCPQGLETESPAPWLEMTPTQSRHAECHLRDLRCYPTGVYRRLNSFIFNGWRPKAHTASRSDYSMIPLDWSLTLAEALLWHLFRAFKEPRMLNLQLKCNSFTVRCMIEFLRKTELNYCFSVAARDMAPCPFRLMHCGPGGHTRGDMLNWRPDFKIRSKLLCEKEWIDLFDSFNVFGCNTTEEQEEGLMAYLKSKYQIYRKNYM